MWCDPGRGVGLAIVACAVDGRAALAFVTRALEPPADSLLLICGRVTACDDLRHARPSRAAGKALDANCIQDHAPMAEVNNPERTVAGGPAEFVSRRLNYQSWAACQSEPLGAEGAHQAAELLRRLALNEGTEVRLEQRERDGALAEWKSLERCRGLMQRSGRPGVRLGRMRSCRLRGQHREKKSYEENWHRFKSRA